VQIYFLKHRLLVLQQQLLKTREYCGKVESLLTLEYYYTIQFYIKQQMISRLVIKTTNNQQTLSIFSRVQYYTTTTTTTSYNRHMSPSTPYFLRVHISTQ
jgi:hypothetical protein